MEQIVYVIVQVVYYFLFVAQILMLLRALSSLFMFDEDGPISNFLYYATEPLIYPLRMLFQKLGAFDDFVFDVPFLATMMAITLLQAVLPTVII